jgi:hypothetical protein
MAVMLRLAVPVFLSVRGVVALWPIMTLPKSIEFGVTEICGVAAAPVAESAIGGTAEAESLVKVMLPLTVAALVGANTTFPVEEVPGARVRGRPKPLVLYPVPTRERAVTWRVALPLLVRVS